MNHADLCTIAVKWLKRPNSAGGHGCQVAVSECAADFVGERPDAIGFRTGHHGGSVLVECKTSRADFMADKAKPHRQPGRGMGTWRYFMAPRGLLSIAELPERWGLLEVNARGHVAVVHGAATAVGTWQAFRDELDAFRHVPDSDLERSLLVRLLARVGDPEALNLRVREALNSQNRMAREIDRLRERLQKAQSRNLMLSRQRREVEA